MRHQPNIEALLLKVWPLLDVQFNELMEMPLCKRNGFEWSPEAGLRAQLIESLAIFIAKRERLLR